MSNFKQGIPAIILARVSTKKQKERGHSLPDQIKIAREYTEKNNLEIYKEFQFDESSIKDKRNKFEEVIKEVKKSKRKIALIIENVDRLQRSFKETPVLDELVKADKLIIHFIREGLIIHKESTGSEFQRWNMHVLLSNAYILTIGDNVKRTQRERVKEGRIIKWTPVGMLNTTNAEGIKMAVPDPERAHFITEIFELYSTGEYSMHKIAKIMEKAGLRSRRGGILKARQIEIILKNKFYIGYQEYRGKHYPHIYEKLTDEKTWDKCQKIRESRGFKRGPKENNPYIFQGFIKCKKCGCSITQTKTNGAHNSGTYIYYHCTNYHRNCKKIYVPEDDITKHIKGILKNIKLPEEDLDKLVKALKKHEENKNHYHKNQLKSLRVEYNKLDYKKSVMYNDRLEGRLSTDEYDKLSNEVKEKQNQILHDLQRCQQANNSYYITAERILKLANKAEDIFKGSEVEEKRELLKMILHNPELDGENFSYRLKTPYNLLFSYNRKTPAKRQKFLWGG